MVDNKFPPNMGQQGMPMQPPVQQPAGNPLAKHLRQPKIYIKLPSTELQIQKKSIGYTDSRTDPRKTQMLY